MTPPLGIKQTLMRSGQKKEHRRLACERHPPAFVKPVPKQAGSPFSLVAAEAGCFKEMA